MRSVMSYKMETRGQRGWPDRCFFGPLGLHFFVEFKRPGKKPTPKQVEMIEELQNKGHEVWVIDDVESFERALDAELKR